MPAWYFRGWTASNWIAARSPLYINEIVEQVLERMTSAEIRPVSVWSFLGAPDILRLLIFAPVVLLTAFGLVMVYSSSMIFSLTRFGDAGYFFWRQMMFAGVGLAVMLVASRIPARLWHRLTVPLLAAAFLGLLMCLTPLGITVKGASRWIGLGGGFNVQPSEIAKVAMVFWIAWSLSRKADRIRSFKVGFLPHVVLAGVFSAMCMKQPDFGAAMMILLLTFVMVFVGGTRLGYLLGSIALLVPFLWVAVVLSPYRMKRVLAFLNPDQGAESVPQAARWPTR